MSLVVKPSTPLTIQFEGGKKLTLHADIVVRMFPKFADAVKTLPVTVDKKDGQTRAVLDLTTATRKSEHLTIEEALRLASFSCGGRYDPCAYSLFKRFGIPIPDIVPSSFSLPNIPLRVKGSLTEGATMALVARGSQNVHWVTGCKSFKTFGEAFPDMPDDFYSVGTQTIGLEATNKFTVARLGDLAHTFVLKVELEGPVDLDTLFESVSISVGGYTSVEIDLQTNNALAKAYGLWPGKNNDAPRQPGQKWVATIPIMSRETTAYSKIVMPLIALYWHNTEITLNKIANKEVRYVLDVDYVYLDRQARIWLANKGNNPAPAPAPSKIPAETLPKPTSEWDVCEPKAEWSFAPTKANTDATSVPAPAPAVPSTPAPAMPSTFVSPPSPLVGEAEARLKASETSYRPKSRGHELVFTQFQTVREFLAPGGGKTRRIPLNMSHPTSGWMITLSPEDSGIKQIGANIAPIVGASLDFNGRRAMEFDFADLTEWNWVKCGMKTPADFCTLLLPCSREMFWADQKQDCLVCPCTVNLSRLDSLVLTVDVNEEMFDLFGWNISITAVSTNFSVSMTGMQGVKYAS